MQTSQPVYLDNNATTRVEPAVLEAMSRYSTVDYGNPHSLHQLGRRAHDAVEEARRAVALLTGSDPGEVVFTSCGTEGNAMVLRGLLEPAEGRRGIVTTAVEHPSVLTLLRALEARSLIELTVVPVDGEGRIDLDAFERATGPSTLLATVMLAQNETGVIHPIPRIAEIAHRAGALLHVDAVQAAGKIAVDRAALGADFLTISGHKFHAPKGIGALVIRRGLRLAPLWYGGGQELGLRSGTEPVPSIVGMGLAAEMARAFLPSWGAVASLRDRLEAGLLESGPASVNGASQPRLPNTASVALEGLDTTAMVLALDEAGICVSGGAACTSGITEPTATMKAMGRPASVRFSLSRHTTPAEIEQTVAAVAAIRRGAR